jgi:DNA/RNA endonuclease YhcR with UshA esterase domain
MEEKTLLKISMLTSIVGVLVLFVISLNVDDGEKNFQLVNDQDYATISGKIGAVSSTGNATFVTVYQTKPVTAVIFSKEYLNLAEGDYVEMRGTVQFYNGKKEFVAEEIRKG